MPFSESFQPGLVRYPPYVIQELPMIRSPLYIKNVKVRNMRE